MFIGHFPPKSSKISGSFAGNDLQLQASYGSSPLCNTMEIGRNFVGVSKWINWSNFKDIPFTIYTMVNIRVWLLRISTRVSKLCKFSKICSLLNALYEMTKEQTFEKFHLPPHTAIVHTPPWSNFSKVSTVTDWYGKCSRELTLGISLGYKTWLNYIWDITGLWWEKERDKEKERVSVCERACVVVKMLVCVSVCVREKDRECARELVCVCGCEGLSKVSQIHRHIQILQQVSVCCTVCGSVCCSVCCSASCSACDCVYPNLAASQHCWEFILKRRM